MSLLRPRPRARQTRTFVIAAVAVFCACAERQTGPAAPRSPVVRPNPSSAAVVIVTNTADGGAGSLRDALASAAPGDTIQFDPGIAGATITLASGALNITQPLTIQGPVPGGIVIDGGGTDRVFAASASLALRDLTVTGGATIFSGGGIFTSDNLTLDHVLVAGNKSTQGGGVYFAPSSSTRTLTVVNSTITGNQSTTVGGGIHISAGNATFSNATVANNSAPQDGGGISTVGGALLTLANTVVAANTAPTGANCNLSGPIALSGVNLSDDASCAAAGASMLVAAPNLGGLANNGGPTQTLALLQTSPAIDAAGGCTVNDDQRHIARPQGAACDIGAYEFNSFVQTPLSIDGSVAVNPTTGVATASGTVSCPQPLSLALKATLNEPQKSGKVNTVVSATNQVTLACNGPTAWSIALTASSGAFQPGSGTVSATTTGPAYVAPASANAAVKLYWGHK